MNSVLYDMIIFDWDGTAVPDRHSPIGDLKAALEELLKEGGLCAVVTGTNLNNILKQGIADLSPLAKQGLHVCPNRGSEVFDFDSEGMPRLIFRRQATQAENKALDCAAIGLHDRIQAQGMKTEITFDRLNRRKVDLIPEPQWFSPKKAQFRELLSAVEERMVSAGLEGGIPKILALAETIARKEGLSAPKVTSDIKHIEIGLTDKGDSADWLLKHIIEPSLIPLSKVSIWGDELGSLGSLPGSDALMRTQELTSACFFSVGVEPEGVPSWVHFLGGGPKRFIEFLFEQARLRREQRNVSELAPSKDSSWILEQDGFDPSRERLMETLFAISNGNLGVRGASDLPVPAAQADLFVAGVYDQLVSSQPYSETDLFDASGASTSTETEIVPLPFPFRFRVRIDGDLVHAANVTRLEHRRCLDFKKGIFFEQNRIESPHGQRTELSGFRICSHADPHLVIQRLKITNENYSGRIDVDLSLYPDEFAALYPHLTQAKRENGTSKPNLAELQTFRTNGSKICIALASRIAVNGRELGSPQISTHLCPGDTIVIERRVSIFSNEDAQSASRQALTHSKSLPLSLTSNIESHLQAWGLFWADSDLVFPQAPGPTDALRFNLYHLRSSAALARQSSVPAKALTGRGYEGHIFWDTEIFIFPFFLYTAPDIARQLLLYRYQTLPGARARARKAGFRGASYAWESTVTGKDVTPSFVSISGKRTPDDTQADSKIPIFTGPEELHVTADVAWAVFKYWDATLDQEFMCRYGVEILIETARFWVSRLTLSGNKYHLSEVVGPDEYHYGVTDNAFTNWMVHFNLEVAIHRTIWLSKEYPQRFAELSSKLSLTPAEIAAWQDVFNRLYVPLAADSGIIEQFSGFFSLTPVKLSSKEKNRAPISRLFGWKEINQTQIVKQADVLMIPFLFPDRLPLSVIKANYDYYEPITDHGSSLSTCVHAAIAARIGKMDEAIRYWRESLYFDLHDRMANSQSGIHTAALGGTWQALVFHLLGVRPSNSGFSIDEKTAARIPREWNGLELTLKYRNRTYSLAIKSGKVIAMTQEAA